MTYRVVVTARARVDAVRAFRWKAEDSPRAAARWYDGLEKAIADLRRNPDRHPRAEEESERTGIDLRELLYGRHKNVYRLLFSIEGETVVLHEVRHSSRGPMDHEDERD
ncbi:type II toxin-antitoxin system RelE/ParE family toxin [Tundrisphaera sp. TA3]|uniref:type II toxin-antitoxin system RelE/ParE family toxin n=1 Tax=Tundrisphaera sp. TA3 TaxID=3435775 RepID=UPI003EC14043